MTELDGLPIVFGVTGHRDIPPADVPALTAAVRSIFDDFGARFPATPLMLLTPLAAGADQLVARAACEAGIPLYVPMPLEEPEYRKDFHADEVVEFDRFLAVANAHYFLGYDGDNDARSMTDRARRARQYALVGRYVARNAHVLIALWDGKLSGAAGGTAQIVDYRLNGDAPAAAEHPSVLDAPLTGAVYHVRTARVRDAEDRPSVAVGTIAVVTRLGVVEAQADPFAPLYARIERFNEDFRRLPAGVVADGPHKLRRVAETLATRFQQRYFFALNVISIGTPIAAIGLAFAHRAEPVYELALAYCVILFIVYVYYKISDAGQWKDRSIEYRALEVALWIQHVWQTIGLDAEVADYYLRIQRSELEWIRDAVRTNALFRERALVDPEHGIEVASAFITSQQTFFARASDRDRQRCKRLERISTIAIAVTTILSVGLFAIAGAHLLHWSPATLGPLWDQGETCVTGIVVATIVAAVSHEFSNRRAFHAQSRRYASIFATYARAREILDAAEREPLAERLRVTSDVAFEIGKEALAENAGWLTMQRELPVELLHV